LQADNFSHPDIFGTWRRLCIVLLYLWHKLAVERASPLKIDSCDGDLRANLGGIIPRRVCVVQMNFTQLTQLSVYECQAVPTLYHEALCASLYFDEEQGTADEG
jgi:hypothetical protein